jgi:hypothetical protein
MRSAGDGEEYSREAKMRCHVLPGAYTHRCLHRCTHRNRVAAHSIKRHVQHMISCHDTQKSRLRENQAQCWMT